MMHKAWGSIEEVPFCFFKVIRQISRSHGTKKSRRFWPELSVPDCNSSWKSLMALEWCTIKAWRSIEEVPYCFSRSSIKFQGHAGKNHRFWPEWSFSGLQLQFEFIHGFEMMHKPWRSTEEVSYCFSKSSCQISRSHGTNKIADFDLNWAFPDCNSSLDSPMDLEWCT